jgi:lipoprotein-anchoring transpeptidase ErfK/SrfK
MRRSEAGRMMRRLAVALLVAAARAHAQDAATGRIVVSIPDRKLAVIEDGRVVKIYRTAVGAAVSPSPVGTYTVVNRIPNPTWYAPGKVIGPGEQNPLGTRWLGLSLKGYGIHGTNVPRSVGHAASHGCIRLRNRDVEELFDLVKVGFVVELVGERTEETEKLFGPAPAVASSADTAVLHGGA